MTRIVALGCALLLSGTAWAQDDAQAAAGAEPNLRVFLDCDYHCDFNFIRTEIAVFDWVRQRQDADVHVLVSARTTGGGGSEYSLRFIGLGNLAGQEDDLRFAVEAGTGSDVIRRSMVRYLKGGLARYALRSPAGDQFEISLARSSQVTPGAAQPAGHDSWNSWVFHTRLNSFFNGESSYSQLNLNGSIAANRTTDEWKMNLSVNTFYARSSFDLGEGNTFVSERRAHGAHVLAVRSLTGHLSAGARTSASHSTFENRDLALRGASAVEYNIFPYAESTRRQLTLQYSLGASHVKYLEETIYFKTEDTLVDHELQVSIGMRQPWGGVNVNSSASQYLHDLEHYRLQLGGNVQLQLIRGFSLNLNGSAARIRDQLHIQRGNLSPEEILLRQRQLQTTFFYFGSVGLSYSFGSIYNTVVNTRFSGAMSSF
jgi:hypothetical protein